MMKSSPRTFRSRATVCPRHGLPLTVEVAQTEAERAKGLSCRPPLLPLGLHGMLFLFDGPGQQGTFTNRATHVALDVSFFDATRRLIATVPMRTIVESGWVVESYGSPRPYSVALETPRGYLARAGVKPRARLERTLWPTAHPDRITTLLVW